MYKLSVGKRKKRQKNFLKKIKKSLKNVEKMLDNIKGDVVLYTSCRRESGQPELKFGVCRLKME